MGDSSLESPVPLLFSNITGSDPFSPRRVEETSNLVLFLPPRVDDSDELDFSHRKDMGRNMKGPELFRDIKFFPNFYPSSVP